MALLRIDYYFLTFNVISFLVCNLLYFLSCSITKFKNVTNKKLNYLLAK